MFDEPAVYLHPSGQLDFIQVLESLGQTSQIVYATHSLFMINRNYPTRHRLIFKDDSGTKLDGKPYVGRWGSTLNRLGLALPGTILFAPLVLLVEGDSDPIYIHAMLQWLIQRGALEVDINGFSSISTGDSKNTEVLVDILTAASVECKVAVLVDGDRGGRQRLGDMKRLLEAKQIPSKALAMDTSIEDHLPGLRELYVPAVAAFYHKLGTDSGKLSNTKLEELRAKFVQDFEGEFPKPETTQGIAEWASKVGSKLYPDMLPEDPSKVGIAREYVDLLLGDPSTPGISRRAKDLAFWIRDTPRPADAVRGDTDSWRW